MKFILINKKINRSKRKHHIQHSRAKLPIGKSRILLYPSMRDECLQSLHALLLYAAMIAQALAVDNVGKKSFW